MRTFINSALSAVALLFISSSTFAANWVLDPGLSAVVFKYNYGSDEYEGILTNVEAQFDIDPLSPGSCEFDVTINIEDINVKFFFPVPARSILNFALYPPSYTHKRDTDTTKSARKDDIPIALLMLSAPTNTEAIKTDAIKTPIGDNPANMATTIPAYPKPGERSAVR